MFRTLTIFALAALIAIAVGVASAQDTVEVVDSTARGGVKAVIDRVDAEVAARAAADVTLQNNIDDEALARAAADASLQSNLDAEAAARAAADAALDGRVSALEAAGGGGTGLLRTIVVSPVGPTEIENGLELFTALENTDLMVPPPSAQDPVLIKVEPGVYNTSIFMRPFVDVEGSGPGLTVIKGTVGDFTAPEPLWIVFMASNSELRELSVQFESSAVSAGATVDTGGIVTGDDQNVSIRNVRIKGPSGPVRTHEGVRGFTPALRSGSATWTSTTSSSQFGKRASARSISKA